VIVATAGWDDRRLCDDGACTGLIGNDGLCRVCGRASKFWGDERRRGMQDDDGDADADDDADADADADSDDGEAAPRRAALRAVDDDDEDRRLCIDGGCTGLQDDNGRCKVCGKVDPDARARVRSSVTAAAGGSEHDAAGDAGDDDDAGNGDGDDDDDADDRTLCPDGACTGLLGADGACKVCGRRAEA
jgi:hypothetical protein